MEVGKLNLYECKHCTGTGTCSTGHDQTSCNSCIKKAELPFWQRKNQQGITCGSCGGIGLVEPTTDRVNKRIAPFLALYLVLLLFVLLLITLIFNNTYFSEVLAFSSAIIGSVSGYYFSSKNK